MEIPEWEEIGIPERYGPDRLLYNPPSYFPAQKSELRFFDGARPSMTGASLFASADYEL